MTSLVVAALLFAVGAALGQATATINGRVVDQGKAVLPGATVTITNMATGTSRDTVTNAEGLSSVPALNPGTYRIKLELAGFAPVTRENVELLTGTTLTVDLLLGVAQIEESLTVTGAAPMVETTQSVLSSRTNRTSATRTRSRSRRSWRSITPTCWDAITGFHARSIPLSAASACWHR